jgi:hypothetical protein
MTQSTHNTPEATMLMGRPSGYLVPADRLAVAPGSSEGDVPGPDQVQPTTLRAPQLFTACGRDHGAGLGLIPENRQRPGTAQRARHRSAAGECPATI